MPALSTVKVGDDTIDFRRWLTDKAIKPSRLWIAAEVLLLSRAIARNKHLRHLDLSEINNLLGPIVVQALVESLAVSVVSDVDNDDDNDDDDDVGRVSPDLRHVDILNVFTKRVTVDTILVPGAELPMKHLQEGTVSSLDFSTKERTSREYLAPLFVLMLRIGRSLTEVDFSNQDFGAATSTVVTAILSLANGKLSKYNTVALQPTREMEVLSLQNQPVMGHGISILASTTIPNGNITELNLSNCCMDADSLGTLLNGILCKRTVTYLDVSNQPLCNEGVQELASFLRMDKKLRALCARNIDMPRKQTDQTLEFAKALETNITLVELDLRENFLHSVIVGRLRRTMEEKRRAVPFPVESKYCFMLCNRRLPFRQRLPDVTHVADVSYMFVDSPRPLFLIFQFCADERRLLVDSYYTNNSDMHHISRHSAPHLNTIYISDSSEEGDSMSESE